jgi:hypothetical protein
MAQSDKATAKAKTLRKINDEIKRLDSSGSIDPELVASFFADAPRLENKYPSVFAFVLVQANQYGTATAKYFNNIQVSAQKTPSLFLESKIAPVEQVTASERKRTNPALAANIRATLLNYLKYINDYKPKGVSIWNKDFFQDPIEE